MFGKGGWVICKQAKPSATSKKKFTASSKIHKNRVINIDFEIILSYYYKD